MRMEVTMPTVQSQTAIRSNCARPAKRAINLSLSADVLDAAKSLQINVSQLCDNYLRDVVRHEQMRRWRVEHADFIAAYNATIETEGLPLDEWRTF
ncbi:MAG: type II toxin-antitoxin system CcdA family antitoxin [Rhodoferax sp.]